MSYLEWAFRPILDKMEEQVHVEDIFEELFIMQVL